jgi:2-phosphosulfolactate phosphatase
MSNTVTIDCFAQNVSRYRNGYAVVAIDVVRATTTAITAVASGRRCFPVPTANAAFQLAGRLQDALLAGEQRGIMPPGFHLNNSPSQLAVRIDVKRPLILLSSSGTQLCHEVAQCDAAFVACLRNYVSTARHLAARFSAVAVVGAGSHNEFREEDQLCCAWLAGCLMDLGYLAADRRTLDVVMRWSNKPVDAWITNKSARYLRTSGQLDDLEFILEHVADLNAPCALRNEEVLVDEPSLNSAMLEKDGKRICDA